MAKSNIKNNEINKVFKRLKTNPDTINLETNKKNKLEIMNRLENIAKMEACIIEMGCIHLEKGPNKHIQMKTNTLKTDLGHL